MRPMNFRRTFYPVGQGAFYVEEFKLSEDSKFTIVYDCGSTTLKIRGIEKEIERVFPKGHQIDILFISHFHADHINGINKLRKHCKIKRVVLPLIEDEDEIIILKILNYIEGNGDTYNLLIENPEMFFNKHEGEREEDTVITQIAPIGYNGENRDKNILPSGEALPDVKVNELNWVFIPFCSKQNERRKLFEDKLKEEELSRNDINEMFSNGVNKKEYNKNKKKLIEIYKSILPNNDLNETSMALYSGPEEAWDNSMIHFYSKFDFRLHFRPTYPYFFKEYEFQSGCLYTGDINLNKDDLVAYIRNKLSEELECIGTLQVPHHGSRHNFEESILTVGNISCAFFSFGIRNDYGHPAYSVFYDVKENGITPCLVTEELKTIVVQEGFLY